MVRDAVIELDDSVGEVKRKRGEDRVACIVHLRDLVRCHPEAAPASAVVLVQAFEAAVRARKAAHPSKPAYVKPPTKAVVRARLLALIRQRAGL